MAPAFLPYGKQEIVDADVKAVVEALCSGWLTTGPRVGEFEKAFAAYCGTAEGVAVNSGTMPHYTKVPRPYLPMWKLKRF